MSFRRLLILTALFLNSIVILYANPILDQPADVILKETRLSRIPQMIQALEDKAKIYAENNKILEAREYLKKAIVLKDAIGMRESEGNAQLLTQISKLESKLGNQCEASQLSKLAKNIYRKIGVNFGAVTFEEPKQNQETNISAAKACGESVTWLKE